MHFYTHFTYILTLKFTYPYDHIMIVTIRILIQSNIHSLIKNTVKYTCLIQKCAYFSTVALC